MNSLPQDGRNLRKLERLLGQPLAETTPRLFNAMGVDDLETTLNEDDRDREKATRSRQQRISGTSLEQSSPRVRRGLGLS